MLHAVCSGLLESVRTLVDAGAYLTIMDSAFGGTPLGWAEHYHELHMDGEHLGVVMPFRFRSAHGVLSFISTTTIFGTPVDVTLQELAMETFFPADAMTGEVLRQLSPA